MRRIYDTISGKLGFRTLQQHAGSDVWRLQAAGIPVRFDRSPFHMHHKYAVFDSASVLTGSYNWTRSAASENHENVIVTADPRLVAAFGEVFETLWQRLE